MRVTLLGTGSADGWPNPFCTCPSCESVRRDGGARTQTAVLIDDALLLDAGPDAPRQATRAGLDLRGLRAVLVTHAHPDHLAPALLLWRSWTHADGPLTVLGPPGVIAACAPWLAPDSPVELIPVRPGDTLTVTAASGQYRVRVLSAAHASPTHPDDVVTSEAVLYDVTAPDGARLLHACDTGPLPQATVDAVRGTAFDVVLLEETFGDVTDHRTGHLDLATFPIELARLRAAGAVLERTTVAAVHLSHHNPEPAELARRLATWGVALLPDLAVIDTARPTPGTARPDRRPRRTLVLGGARSGKSREAERRLADRTGVTYVATGGRRDGDSDWQRRVDEHRRRRPAGWTTVESTDLAAILAGAAPADVLLVDCLTLWLTAVLDGADAWSGDPGDPLTAVHSALDDLVAALRDTRADVVLVSNEVGQGVVPATASGRLFRDLMGVVNARVAAGCEDVVLLTAGIATTLRTAPSAPTVHVVDHHAGDRA